MSKIAVRNLVKAYQQQLVIDQLSFTLEAGERLALFAPSGAGKTTLLKILAGLDKPDAGSVLIEEQMPAMLFQEPRLFPYMTVEENIHLPIKLSGQSWTEKLIEDYENWLTVCELSDFRNKYPFQLSGGMRQKVALVRGLLWHPKMAFLDEPFNSIGMSARRNIIEVVKKQNPDLTLLLATHNLEEIALLADSVLYFSGNRLENPLKISAPKFVTKFAGFINELNENEPGDSSLKRRIHDYSSQFLTL